ncbi:M48 family metalloprotease [Alkalibacillus haloalkaliphilus]|uniref:Uncharacterized protein n=1 Tax=Alkalibacillus haloalkaliphilus TaxID=94136 RepID=A0A511W7J8_9BACI|nr:hypothetical protein [Alkalibacillus haloalkaliphilus]GEN46701.1 hypothetical protein AHA02nite_24770 [Alkalibacillus haloalkaliphilus]
MDYNYMEQHKQEQSQHQEHAITNHHDEVSIMTWIFILILTAIPFINLIALLVMAFGTFNPNINNFGKAVLILMAIGIIIGILTAF